MEKRSVTLKGHRTSVALEREFWIVLEHAARRDGKSLAQLISHIDARRLAAARPPGLASALRVYALRRALDERATGAATLRGRRR